MLALRGWESRELGEQGGGQMAWGAEAVPIAKPGLRAACGGAEPGLLKEILECFSCGVLIAGLESD